jgi:Zn-dependent peptidase ImmA (M78 family)/transcriptional regulator with XRE-family HTH domain
MPELIYAEINPKVLKWARESRGFSIGEAAKKIKISNAKLQQAENGTIAISMNQLRTVSKVYKRPVPIFYLNEVPEEPTIPDLRKIRRGKKEEFSPKVRLVLREYQEKQLNAADLYSILQLKYSYSFIGLFDISTPYEIAGQRIRQLLGVNSEQIPSNSKIYEQLKFWKKRIEALGILVFQFQGIGVNEMRGFVFSKIPYPTIAVNQKDSIHARIFTLIHELTHIILKVTGICDPYFSKSVDLKSEDMESTNLDDLETYCNYVAGATLVSMEDLAVQTETKNINERNVLDHASKLSNHFKVSREVILRRLLIGNHITKRIYEQSIETIESEYSKREDKSSGGDFYQNFFSSNSNEYMKIVFQGVRTENITVLNAITFLGVKYDTFEAIKMKYESESSDN